MKKMFFSKIYSEYDNLTDPIAAKRLVSAICRPIEGRTLFKVSEDASGPYLFLQSPTAPRFDVMPGIKHQTKEVCISLKKDGRYSFSVCCNPVKKNIQGKRIGISDHKERVEWLQRSLGEGLKILEVSTASNGMLKFEKPGKSVSAYAVSFKGTIQVIDSEKAESVVTSGIGKCKAFGLGMLSLRPA